ncbi:hypothetical protein THIOKS180027 [Thiocapsa sp. KS1]|nr:hypothetical protein THIOKS180027 [Thiocapsa sp. KS1]
MSISHARARCSSWRSNPDSPGKEIDCKSTIPGAGALRHMPIAPVSAMIRPHFRHPLARPADRIGLRARLPRAPHPIPGRPSAS